jgi:hypothetical protein
MRKLHIINHNLMPEVKTCAFNLTSEDYYSYIMASKSSDLYYEILIKPFKNGFDGNDVILRDREMLEDLILTNAEYFCIKLCDLNRFVIEVLYEKRKEYPKFYLN